MNPQTDKVIEEIIDGAISRLVQKYGIPQLQNYKSKFMLLANPFWRMSFDELTRDLFGTFVDLNIVQLQPHQEEEGYKFWESVSQELWTKVGRGGVNI